MVLALKALEISFIGVLLAVVIASGLIAMVVVVRLVEPRGARALAERVLGRDLVFPRRRRPPA